MFFASLLGCVLFYDPPFAVAKSPDSQLPGDGGTKWEKLIWGMWFQKCGWSMLITYVIWFVLPGFLGIFRTHTIWYYIYIIYTYIYINPPIMAPGKLGFFRVSARTPHGSMVNSPLGWSSRRPYGPFVVLRRRWLRNHRERVLRKIMSLLCKSRRVQCCSGQDSWTGIDSRYSRTARIGVWTPCFSRTLRQSSTKETSKHERGDPTVKGPRT